MKRPGQEKSRRFEKPRSEIASASQRDRVLPCAGIATTLVRRSHSLFTLFFTFPSSLLALYSFARFDSRNAVIKMTSFQRRMDGDAENEIKPKMREKFNFHLLFRRVLKNDISHVQIPLFVML